MVIVVREHTRTVEEVRADWAVAKARGVTIKEFEITREERRLLCDEFANDVAFDHLTLEIAP